MTPIGCPRDGCDGEIEMIEETAETYTNHGLSVWSYTYLLMNSDPGTCSEGCQFTADEQKQIEREATEAGPDDSWMDP